MGVSKGEIGIYGVLRRDGGDGVLAKTDQIKDTILNKTQQQLNQEVTTNSAQVVTHIRNTSNPHQVTKQQIQLGNVTNDAQVKRSEMGVANGVAILNASAKVPSDLLDDIILIYNSTEKFPTTGETNKLYIADKLIYLWNGTTYEEISKTLSVGTTEGTAYEGNKGVLLETNLSAEITRAKAEEAKKYVKPTSGIPKTDLASSIQQSLNTIINKVDKVDGKQLSTNDYTTAEKNKVAESINESTANTLINTAISKLTKTSIGLSNVDNTSDKNKPISTATQAALDNKVDIVTGKSLVANSEIVKLTALNSQTELDTAIADAKQVGTDAKTSINSHIKNTSNPHNVTKAQIGLNDVNNTSDMDKPVSTAQQTALDEKVDKTTTINGHVLSSNVTVTKEDIGLDNVDNTADTNKEVLSATKLKTQRTIWGQSFNGTADVSGNLKGVTEIYLSDGSKYVEPCTSDDIKALFI